MVHRMTDRSTDRAHAQSMPLPGAIAGIAVPEDDLSARAWEWANRSLPNYLLTHSVRSYCWGAAIADREGWEFDRPILWTAALFHDIGLTRISRNTTCFEVEGAEIARRFATRIGVAADAAERVARAIVMHMQPATSLDDGIESVLLDRATGLDVRGVDYGLVDPIRAEVLVDYPRGTFDRHFLKTMTREAAAHPTCQGARLVNETGLAGWMERSPWRNA